MEDPRATLAANLLRLRSARGLTQGSLAEAAGLSRAGYRNIEMGAASPRSGTVQALARVLRVPTGDLVRPVERLAGVRFRSGKRLNCRDTVVARAATWLGAYRQLEEALDSRIPFAFRDAVRGRGRDEGGSPAELAASIRRRLHLAESEPVRNICGLLESSGVKVLPLSVASEGFFGLSVSEEGRGPAIVVNIWERISVERWIFTAAHELGHILLHANAFDASDPTDRPDEEKEADRFAAAFLLPDVGFRKEWDASAGLPFVERVLTIKRMFRVSYRTVLFRLAASSSLGKGVWGRFKAEYRARYQLPLLGHDEPERLLPEEFTPAPERAADEPDRLSSRDFTEDRFRLLVRRAVEAEHITLSRAAEMLGIRLGEMRALAASWVD